MGAACVDVVSPLVVRDHLRRSEAEGWTQGTRWRQYYETWRARRSCWPWRRGAMWWGSGTRWLCPERFAGPGTASTCTPGFTITPPSGRWWSSSCNSQIRACKASSQDTKMCPFGNSLGVSTCCLLVCWTIPHCLSPSWRYSLTWTVL